MFYFDAMRRHEHMLIGIVIGLVIAAIAYHTPSTIGSECITKVNATRPEVIPGAEHRIAEVAYQIQFEGRLVRYNGRSICNVDFKEVDCFTRGRSIDCHPVMQTNKEDKL